MPEEPILAPPSCSQPEFETQVTMEDSVDSISILSYKSELHQIKKKKKIPYYEIEKGLILLEVKELRG